MWDHTGFIFLGPVPVLREDVMVGAGVLSVPTLGDGALILRATLDSAGVSTLGDTISPTLRAGDVCNTLGGASGLFSNDLNRFASCIKVTNWVSPMRTDGASVLGYSNASVKYAAAREARSEEDINGIFV